MRDRGRKANADQRNLNASSSSRRNRRIIVGLLVGACVLVCAIVYYSGGDEDYGGAIQAIERRDFRRASRILNQFVKDHPDDLKAILLAAQTSRREGDTLRTRELLRAYEAKGGGKKQLERERMLLRVQEGDTNDSAALLDSCRSDPESVETALTLEAVIEGDIKQLVQAMFQEVSGQGKIDANQLQVTYEAIALWMEHFRKSPDQVQGLIWRAKWFGIKRDYPKAAADFRAALELDPDHFEARQRLAGLLTLETPDEAVTHFTILHHRDPTNTEVSFALAQVLRSLGRTKESGVLLDELLADDANNVGYLLERGRAALDSRDFAEAQRTIERAVLLAPEHPDANLSYSQYLQIAGKEEEARKYRKRYAEIIARSRQGANSR